MSVSGGHTIGTRRARRNGPERHASGGGALRVAHRRCCGMTDAALERARFDEQFCVRVCCDSRRDRDRERQRKENKEAPVGHARVPIQLRGTRKVQSSIECLLNQSAKILWFDHEANQARARWPPSPTSLPTTEADREWRHRVKHEFVVRQRCCNTATRIWLATRTAGWRRPRTSPAGPDRSCRR